MGGDDARDPELRAQLLAMKLRDQEARGAWVRTRSDADGEAFEALDAEHLEVMRAVIDRVGWPGASLVGQDGADAAWLLVQHFDADPAFQARCLVLLKEAVTRGDARPSHLAYLTDRVAVNTGQLQVYGTQHDGDFVPQPMIDPEAVDERRASVGLGPLADYLEQSRAVYTDSGP